MPAAVWTIRSLPDHSGIEVLDQTLLPREMVTVVLPNVAAVATAIRTMRVRGAPLIGVTAAWGIALALRDDPSDAALDQAATLLHAQRPTAVNLGWAIDRVVRAVQALDTAQRADAAWELAAAITAEDGATNEAIGRHGVALIEAAAARKPPGTPVHILTHCNAGVLACTAWGTATAPIYRAHAAGIAVHVWVDETRPRNQGAALTAWELGQAGIPHTVIVDNAGGHLMQRGLVDLCLVGADRVARNGDVANKIGTYLKALAAHDTGVPFHVAMPTSTIDRTLADGTAIPIEARDPGEVLQVIGWHDHARVAVDVAPPGARAANPGFDVTPARLVTGFITERGRCAATRPALDTLLGETP
ncbi:MAG: S-methyl-5-thioribose-1-phosphate isomerase [Gemmatimonadetes bacterium]|nr:S-methyl-5-thioribose-1-phosphate isomerase [Gemmatimonadota bacterium]